MSTRIDQSANSDGNVLRFAALAADHGWSRATFERFRQERDIDVSEALNRWPAYERSLAWSFNQIADEAMLASWQGKQPSLRELMSARFDQNLPYKRAVAALARSDALHPFDTLLRTAQTARRMRALCTPHRAGRFARWSLVFLYSAVVLVWLADATLEQRRTRAAVRAAAFILGAP